MSLTNPLLPKQGTLGQSPTINLPPVTVPGTTTTGGTTTGSDKPTIDKIFDFIGGLAGTLFPGGLGGSTTPPPVYSPAPAPAAASSNLPVIGFGLLVLYLFRDRSKRFVHNFSLTIISIFQP